MGLGGEQSPPFIFCSLGDIPLKAGILMAALRERVQACETRYT